MRLTLKELKEELYSYWGDVGNGIVVFFPENKFFKFINDSGFIKVQFNDGILSKAKLKMDDYYKKYGARVANQIWEEENLGSGQWLKRFAVMSIEEYFNKLIWSYEMVHPIFNLIRQMKELGELEVIIES